MWLFIQLSVEELTKIIFQIFIFTSVFDFPFGKKDLWYLKPPNTTVTFALGEYHTTKAFQEA